MRSLANLIIFSMMLTFAGLSKATTGFVDPTRPANYVDPVETPSVQDTKEKKSEGMSVKAVQIPDYKLNAIKISHSFRIAIINGQTVSPGQKIGTGRLVRINSYSVVINVNCKEINISLLPDSIKTRSTKQLVHQNNGKYDENL